MTFENIDQHASWSVIQFRDWAACMVQHAYGTYPGYVLLR